MNQHIDEATWTNNSLLIKSFIEQRPKYEQLCQEIAYVLKTAVEEKSIEYSSISSRAKTLKSFLEKITRKTYSDPVKNITDFAGVRLVFLYNSDFASIEKVIKANFNVVEKVDKLNDKGTDKFGYGAIHYVVRLSKKHSGARYDDLKDLVCEIQVRTVLQDSWAIIDHHLVYKNESDVPKQLRRKLNSLAGLFETADDQFNQIKKEREAYIESVHESKGKPSEFLDTELNIDSFKQFLLYKFPDIPVEAFHGQLNICFDLIKRDESFKKLKDINTVLKKADVYIDRIDKLMKRSAPERSSTVIVTDILGLYSDDIINTSSFGADDRRKILKFRKEVGIE